MGKVIDIVIVCTVAFLMITQVIVPIITGGELFWLFRKINPDKQSVDKPSLKQEVKEVKDKYKEVKTSVERDLNSATKMKDDLDNLNNQ